MSKLFIYVLFIGVFFSCDKTSKEEGEDKYKNKFLKLLEFDCDGITSEYFIFADIDGVSYCKSSNDTISSVIILASNHTTYTPNSIDTIPGSSYKTILFGIFKDFDLSKTIKEQYFFISGEYEDKATMQDIASNIFVKGKIWPIRNSNNGNKAISCIYQFSDNRVSQNTFYEVNSKYGYHKNHFLTMDDVLIDTIDNNIIYNVNISFEADLYMSDTQILNADNLWAELRNGKMKAKFIVSL